MKKDNPIVIIAILIMFFGNCAMVYTGWGTEATRSLLAVFNMFWAFGWGLGLGMYGDIN
jgi:hypothetical protein